MDDNRCIELYGPDGMPPAYDICFNRCETQCVCACMCLYYMCTSPMGVSVYSIYMKFFNLFETMRKVTVYLQVA